MIFDDNVELQFFLVSLSIVYFIQIPRGPSAPETENWEVT